MATIKDVAKAANVSISTVSRVLNNSGYTSEKTRKKVMETVEKLNYHKNMIATAMIKKQTSTFGLIIPDIKNVFYADLTRAVEDAANKNGFNVILCNTDNDLDKELIYVNFLIQKGIDGIIFSTPEVRDNNINRVLEIRPDLPVITLGSQVRGVQVNEVIVDNLEGGYIASKYLLDLGHRNIGFIGGSEESYATIERKKGFEQAMEEKGVKVNSNHVFLDEFKIENGYKHSLQMLSKKERPTAIFAANDAIAVGIYRAARKLGLEIPDDLSVVGFDNSEYATIVYPELTTVHTPVYEIGERAMEMIIKETRNKETAKETVVFRPTLIERESAAAYQG